ncbi:MAG TPA: DUF1559 domain-containing protein [Gemmataceae bacterium]|nr:DUF1559 domain-containing protein [Gemmataceae bacterium]
MHKLFALALALAVALPAAGADGDARAKPIAPFLDEQTFAVARLDLTRLDAGALAGVLVDLGGVPADDAADVKESADRWLGAFTRAGGKELFVVFSLADMPHFPFVLVPLGEGADAKALSGLLNLPGVPEGPREKVGDNVLFAGGAAARERLRSLKRASRPELAKALAAAGDGALQVALIPPPSLTRVVGEMMPQLPREAGGGPSAPLTRGVRWAALGIEPPPKMALRLTVQSPSAAAAEALNNAVGRALKSLGEQKEVVAALPDFPKMAARLAPKVEQDRLTLTLDGEEAREAVAPLVRLALVTGARAPAAERMKQLALAAHMYVDAHGRLPAVARFDKAGKPLLSWRVLILPYVGEEKLYKEFHLDEPWDSDHNKKLVAKMPDVFRGPNRKLNSQGKTTLLAPVGKDTAFTGKTEGRRFPQEFTDGTSNTILLVLADDAHAVEWTKPDDLKIDLDNPAAGLGRQLGKFLVALADGSAHLVKPTISKQTLRNAFTANDGQVLGADWE